jgi:hypothetical protein
MTRVFELVLAVLFCIVLVLIGSDVGHNILRNIK